jgi:predicted lipoprotein with Yx(FWY)xxD motif
VKRSRLIAGGVTLVVAAIAVIAIATSGGASSTKSSSAYGSSAPGTSRSTPTTQPTTTMPAPMPAPAAVPTGAMVRTAHDATLGDILVAGNGRTVYEFDQDRGTVSACTGACAATWPAWMTGGAPVAGPGVDSTMLASAHGQVTYGGHLLYFFAGDQAAGQVNGVSIPGWHAISPAGSLVGR